MTASSISVPPRPLAGQVIAVSGADQGYGRLTAAALARAGASVALIGQSTETLSSLASRLEQQGGTAFPIQADVTVVMDWLSAQERILELFGQLGGVVHVADRRTQTHFTALSEGEWMELFNANLKSSVAIAQIIARRLTGTWLTLIGPHLDDTDVQVWPQRGALEGLVRHAWRGGVRANLILPARASSGDETLDAPVSDTVVALAAPGLAHLSGTVLDVPLPDVPKLRVPEMPYL